MTDKTLLIFNLKTDADDAVLGFTTDWINALAARSKQVFVLTMYAGRIQVAANVQVFSIGHERGAPKVQRAVNFYRILSQLLRDNQIDVCFAHMIPEFAILGWPLLKPRGIPILLWYAHKSTPLRLKLAEKIVDRVVTSSMSGFQLRSSKRSIIGQGIDTKRFVPASGRQEDQPFTVLSVGRLSQIKRVELLIQAAGHLSRERPHLAFKVVIIGGPLTDSDEAYANGLRVLALELGLGETIQFVGNVPFKDVLPFYQTADVFINPSDTDSVDKTVLEAMSCELPVVTSNIAFREILGAELAKEWVIAKDSPKSIAERLIVLADMASDARSKIGQRLRQVVVDSHSLPSLADKIVQECEAQVSGHKSFRSEK